MSLHTNSVDRNACLLHLLHHLIYTLALVGVHGAVVIIEQQGIRICLTCKLKGLGYELFAAELVVAALTIRVRLLSMSWTTAVGYSLVHHIPRIHHVLVTVDNGMDMLAQTLIEHFFLYRLALLIHEHPVCKLRVPAQAVTTHLYAVLTAEVSYLVCPLEVPHTLFRMYHTRLPVVLGRHTVILFLNDSHLCLVRNITLVNCHSDGEIVLVGIFQSRTCRIISSTSPLCRGCHASDNKR